MNKVSQKSFRIVRGRPYSSEGGCIVYVVPPEVAECHWQEDYFQLWESFWEDIIVYCGKIRGCIYPVLVLSADGRRLLRVRGLDGTLLLPEGVEEVADYAAANNCNDGIEDSGKGLSIKPSSIWLSFHQQLSLSGQVRLVPIASYHVNATVTENTTAPARGFTTRGAIKIIGDSLTTWPGSSMSAIVMVRLMSS